MCANRLVCQVDRRAALGTIDNLDVLPQFCDLLCRQGPDKILLPQELEETDQTAMALIAAEITEACAPLHVLDGA